mgnify:CR=1 FL=1
MRWRIRGCRMSELEQLPTGKGPLPVASPASGEGASSEGGAALRQTFWAVVGRAYWRGAFNRVSLLWIVGMVVLSVVVPFIANEAPYTVVINGTREFPLFRNLSRLDWLWLLWGAAGLVYGVHFVRTGRQAVALEQLRARRSRWFWILLLIAGVGSGAILGLKRDYLDKRDYHGLAQQGELKQAVFAPLRWGYADYEPLELDRVYEYPSRQHLLGTDGNGRDALARLLWGTRVVLEIGLVSQVIALVLGVVFGAVVGYFMGKVDMLGMRFVEMVEAVPTLFLLITIIAIFGRQLLIIMVVIGVTSWTGIARFVRAEFFRIRQMDYVAAAKAMGLPLRNILFKHMLPNGLTPVIVSFTFGVAGAVASESILSFLGIGVPPPTPSWGAMLDEAGNPGQTFRWWLAIAPGLMIFLTVFAYNIMGEGMRDAIDPTLNRIE